MKRFNEWCFFEANEMGFSISLHKRKYWVYIFGVEKWRWTVEENSFQGVYIARVLVFGIRTRYLSRVATALE